MWLALLAAVLMCCGCGDKSVSPADEPLDTQVHAEPDVVWAKDKVVAREIQWRFLSFEPEAPGNPATIGHFSFALVNSDSTAKRVAYDLHFLNARGAEVAVALYPYTALAELPLLQADSTLAVSGFFQTSALRSAALANSITQLKLYALFYAPEPGQ